MAQADPIKAAEQLAGSVYGQAQQRNEETKRALLDRMASQGTYQNTVNQSTAQAATNVPALTAAATPELQQLATAPAQQVNQAGQAVLQAAAQLAQQQAAQRQAAAATYFDQLAAAVPLEQSRAQSEASQILANLIAERERQAAEREMRQLSLQMQREQLAAERERRAAASQPESLPIEEQLAVRLQIGEAVSGTIPWYNSPRANSRRSAFEAYVVDPTQTPEELFARYNIENPQHRADLINALNAYNRASGSETRFGLPHGPFITPEKKGVDRTTGRGGGGGGGGNF